MRTSTRLVLLLAVALVVVGVVWLAQPRAGEPPVSGSSAPAGSPPTQPPTQPATGPPTQPTARPTIAPGSDVPTAPPVAILAGAGDISECDNDRDAATADILEGIDGTVFTLGDNAYENGSARDYEACYGPTWGRPSIKARTMPVVGNHEYRVRGAADYFAYFGAAAGDPGNGWYAYDAGTWRVYVLNSNCGEVGGCEAGSEQHRWLRDDLAVNPRDCVVAMWHHPRFSSGDHGNHEVMADAWQALQDAGAELALAGHDHSYERFGPQDASGNPDETGLVQIVVGTGGRDAYAFEEVKPNSLVRATPVYGVLRLELRPNAYTFEFLPIDGTAFTDRGEGSCR